MQNNLTPISAVKMWPRQDISYLSLDAVNGFSADIDN